MNEINWHNYSIYDAIRKLEQNPNTVKLAEWLRKAAAFDRLTETIRIQIAQEEKYIRFYTGGNND